MMSSASPGASADLTVGCGRQTMVLVIGAPERLALFLRARRLRHREEALEMTPDQRLAVTRPLLAFAASARPPLPGRGTDEPAEFWLRRRRPA